jgi:hypothetical protein
MDATDVWKIVLGAAVALAGTLLAQWSGLAYQTRRQREARQADFQRTTLLQLRDALGELDDAVLAFFLARHEALEHAGGLGEARQAPPRLGEHSANQLAAAQHFHRDRGQGAPRSGCFAGL